MNTNPTSPDTTQRFRETLNRLLWNKFNFSRNARSALAQALWLGLTFEAAVEALSASIASRGVDLPIQRSDLATIWWELEREVAP